MKRASSIVGAVILDRSISIVGVALLGGVLLGFGGCGSSYNGGDASHHCLCDRLNGEGGLPAWVCDQ